MKLNDALIVQLMQEPGKSFRCRAKQSGQLTFGNGQTEAVLVLLLGKMDQIGDESLPHI